MSQTWSTIGSSEKRKDAWKKVVGQAEYTADIDLPGLLFAALLRSPHHSALIKSINVETAQKMPGVVKILTSGDVPGSKVFGALLADQPVLAFERVHHIGEPVVLVIAQSETEARAAAQHIQVNYEVLPAVLNPLEALQPDAPLVHPTGNLLSHYLVEQGNIQQAFSSAEVVIEQSFSVQRISPGYLEPEISQAVYNPDGSLTVWVSSQHPFGDRLEIAHTLGLPEEKIQVKSAVIGGAFGGREDSSLAVLAALAAWSVKGPVRVLNQRSESFTGHPKRHPGHLKLRLAANKAGIFQAFEAIVHLDTGAFASYGPAVGSLLTEVIPGAYAIPNTRVETHVVYTNSPLSGAVRGFGAPQALFATESLVDMLAGKLGMDPLELRRLNIFKPEDKTLTGVNIGVTANSLPVVLEHLATQRERLRALPPRPGKLAGTGLSLLIQSMGLGAKVTDSSSQLLEWLPDGKVRLYLGAPDMGQGLSTVAEQIVAEQLEIPYTHIETVPIDTHVSPMGGVTCASRMTYLVGNALILSSDLLKQKLLDLAGRYLGKDPASLVYSAGQILTPAGQVFSAAEFTSRLADDEKPLSAEASFTYPYPPETTPQQFSIGMPHVDFCFGGHLARVEVDMETGQVDLTDLVAIHDVGQAINRAAVEGQIEGGAVMGIGYALYEDMPLKPQGDWVCTFSEYLMPTSADIPAHLEAIIVENPLAGGPFGAKGIGEMSLPPVAPAIANAIFDATGKRITSLPITPEKILNA
jgi:CO/xanthine dehydrogenase Mo-binding subunit